MIITIRNSFSYVSWHFNSLARPLQNRIIKAMSYYRKTGRGFNEICFFHQKLKNQTHEEYYQFPTGLLNILAEHLKGIPVEIRDLRGEPAKQISVDEFYARLSKVNSTIQERDYQRQAIEAGLKAGRGIISHSTSAGKTVAMAGILFSLNCRSLILCVGKEHIFQLSDELMAYTGRRVTKISSAEYDERGPIVVANVQKLDAIKQKDIVQFRRLLDSFKCVVSDECFAPGTVVTCPGKDRLISELKTGDPVLAYDYDANKFSIQKIKRTVVKPVDELFIIETKAGYLASNGNDLIFSGSGWSLIKNCRVKDRVWAIKAVQERLIGLLGYPDYQPDRDLQASWLKQRKNHGRWVGINRIFTVKSGSDLFNRLCPGSKVYSFELYGTNTFFANGHLVHNCHHVGSDTYKQVFYYAQNARYKFGFSGTVFREDNAEKEITAAIGQIINHVGYDYLTENRYIASARPLFMDPLCDELNEYDDYWPECFIKGVVENEKRNLWISRICGIYVSKNQQVLVLSSLRESHGRALQKIIPSSRFVSGRSSKYDRESAMTDFRKGKFKVLLSTSIMDEIVSLHGVRCVIFAGGGKAHNKVYQRIGRGLRLMEGKDQADIIIPWDSHSKILLRHSQRIYDLISRVKIWKQNIRFLGQGRKYPGKTV